MRAGPWGLGRGLRVGEPRVSGQLKGAPTPREDGRRNPHERRAGPVVWGRWMRVGESGISPETKRPSGLPGS